jgi:hypothetical protein
MLKRRYFASKNNYKKNLTILENVHFIPISVSDQHRHLDPIHQQSAFLERPDCQITRKFSFTRKKRQNNICIEIIG